MTTESRDEILKKAVNLLLTNLIMSDWVGIVTFRSDATVYNTKLVRATKENIEKMKEFILNQKASGGTNFSEAFVIADKMIKESIYDENNSPCKTFVMFLTDGNPTSGTTSESGILSLVNSLESFKKAIIFSYALGSTANRSIPKAISCMRNGIFEAIDNVDNLNIRLNSYFVTLSLGMNVSKPVWAEPYEDSSGLGIMTTCSIPVYDRSVSPIRFIGVVGIDILMSYFYQIEPNKDVVSRKLLSKSLSACTNSDATECQINTLRTPENRCTELDGSCSMVTIDFPTCPNKMNNVWCGAKSLETLKFDNCCGTSPTPCTVPAPSSSNFLISNIIMSIILLIAIFN